MNLKLSNLGVTTSSNAGQIASMGGSIGTVVTDSYVEGMNGFALRFVPSEFEDDTYPKIADATRVWFYSKDNGNNFFLV